MVPPNRAMQRQRHSRNFHTRRKRGRIKRGGSPFLIFSPDTGAATSPTTPWPTPLTNPTAPPFLAPLIGFITTPVMPSLTVCPKYIMP